MRQTDKQLAQINGLTNKQFRSKYKVQSKAKRQRWWNSLTPEQQEDYIEHKQELKAKKRATTPITNKYPEPIITAENRAEWEKKILSKNPWMQKGIFKETG